jgi:hypothetical protein
VGDLHLSFVNCCCLAFRCGSIPEFIEDGVTGKVVESEDEAVAVLPAIMSYDRRKVRQRV